MALDSEASVVSKAKMSHFHRRHTLDGRLLHVNSVLPLKCPYLLPTAELAEKVGSRHMFIT